MNTAEYHIEFDGGQLTIRTDVERVARFVESTYSVMLVPHAFQGVRVVEILRRGPGKFLCGDSVADLEGADEAPLLPWLKEEVILGFMRARPDLLWLHAGAVARGDEAIVICGQSGRGKSTLVTLLCESGWKLMSDDVAPVRMEADEVLPFCQTPLRRIFPGRMVSDEHVGSLEREVVVVDPGMLRKTPALVKAIVFPEFTSGYGADIRPLPRGDSALGILKNARNIVDHKAAAVERAAVMARQLPAYRLTYGSPSAAARLLNALR